MVYFIAMNPDINGGFHPRHITIYYEIVQG